MYYHWQGDSSNKDKQICVKRNICWSFEGCSQAFEGYKLTFVYAVVYARYALHNVMAVLHMWPGLRKWTMWVQITPSYIFANIFISGCGIPFP